jgi:hypothetical protein
VDRQAEARETARRHASRALHLHQDEDGMGCSGGGSSRRWGRCSCRRSPPHARRCTSGPEPRRRRRARLTRPRTRRRWPSSRRTRWPCSRRRRCITGSIRAPRGERYQVVVHVDVLHPLATRVVGSPPSPDGRGP